jgi:ubiquinone/menaquinone biosynthesis C-methylase UbiE
MPGFGAWLYDHLMRGKALDDHYADIARDLLARGATGRLLDVGMGPGRVLAELHRLDASLSLHGLDISDAMIKLARRNLSPIQADLRSGSIAHTDYDADFFDVVTCAGSFYLWDHPEAGLNEAYRILRPGRMAHLYESVRDHDASGFQAALKRNQKDTSFLHRLVGPYFLRRQLRMTYSTAEIRQIVMRSHFGTRHSFEPITLGGLPIWLRISLTKPDEPGGRG